MQNYKKPILITVVLLLLILVPILFISLGRVGKEKIVINYAPKFATLTINDKEVSGNVHYLKPGTYKIELKYDNFITNSRTIDTNNEKEVYLVLFPANQTGESIAKNDPSYNKEVEKIISDEYAQNSQLQDNLYPFKDKLPIKMGVRYTIGYGKISEKNKSQNKQAMALYVDSDSAYSRGQALKDISTKLNINPADIEIIFKQTDNPFEENNVQ